MRARLPILLSATALLVAVFGSTPLGHAAGRVIHAVPPFAKTAGYAKFAGNASQLNGRKSTLSGAPGTIPVVGRNGKLPASIGAVGPQGAAGLRGPAGPRGSPGSPGAEGEPGMSGYEIVTVTSALDATDTKFATARCPAGKKVVGGTGEWVGYGIENINEAISSDTAWTAVGYELTPNSQPWGVQVQAICVRVAT
jgi:hypothetical protein